jgi:RNA polymerase sigma-70 factor, ECF subfamily
MPDEREFSALFSQLHPGLCRFLSGLLGDRGAAQDLAQESFLRLHRHGVDSLPGDEARFWLYRVARNLALNELGRRRTRRRLREQLTRWLRGESASPEVALSRAQDSSLVQRLVAELPEHQRAVLLLREQEAMSYREIARVLDVSEAKVKVDLFRARTAARRRWQEMRAQHAPASDAAPPRRNQV